MSKTCLAVLIKQGAGDSACSLIMLQETHNSEMLTEPKVIF